jgi:hypothetical protein
MNQLGYNWVRVFVDQGDVDRTDGINGNGTTPLSAPYIANMVDFVQRAGSLGVYVMLTTNGLPVNSYFGALAGPLPAWCGFDNADPLVPARVAAWAQFVALLATAMLQGLGGDSSPIFAYSVANEACYLDNEPPFSASSGNITTADGLSYDMAVPASRQQCADANAVHWSSSLAAAIHAVDPGVMVTVGVFTFQAVGKSGPNGILPEGTDPRHPFRAAVMTQFASLDYLDVHIYPVSSTWTLAADLATEEWPAVDFARMPVAMAEFGAFNFVFANLTSAAAAMVALQRDSCAANFSAWALWTWDTWEQEGFLYDAVQGNSTIGIALAPTQRPDPCS